GLGHRPLLEHLLDSARNHLELRTNPPQQFPPTRRLRREDHPGGHRGLAGVRVGSGGSPAGIRVVSTARAPRIRTSRNGVSAAGSRLGSRRSPPALRPPSYSRRRVTAARTIPRT